MRLPLWIGLVLVVVAAGAALADGPETGVVTGRTTDAEGSPLPGVLVTLSGDRGDQVVVAGADGSFRFALLPPGGYKVSGQLEGFQPAEGLADVSAGRVRTVDLMMILGTSEEITVTSEAPMVDKFNVTAGQTITAEVGVEAAGTTRSYYGVINMLPGVTSDGDNRDIQEMRPSVNGSHFADQGVYIDGVDTTFARLGGSRVILPTTATTEVTMEAGGAGAEYGRVTGSSTNVIVKSGTNRFRGEVLGVYGDAEWYGEYKDQPILENLEFGAAPRDFFKRTEREKDQTSTSSEASLGGPIKRNKMWFFMAYNDSTTDNLDKLFNGTLVDTSVFYSASIAKLNFQPGASHQLAVSWMDSPVERVYAHTPSSDKWNPTPHKLGGDLASVTWNWSLSNSVFLESKIATQTSDENKLLATGGTGGTMDPVAAIRLKQQDPGFPPGPGNLAEACAFENLGGAACHYPGNNFRVYAERDNNSAWHNGWILDNGFGKNEFPREQANTALTWFANDAHEFKFGIDWQQVQWIQDVERMGFYSGVTYDQNSRSGYTEYDSGVPFDVTDPTGCGVIFGAGCLWIDYQPSELVAQGKGSGSSMNENLVLYGRDRFTVGDHLVFNIGLRASKQENFNDVGHLVVDTETIEPRLSMTYDIKGDGKMLTSINVGRYYAQLNQQFTNRWLLEEWAGHNAEDWFLWCNATDVFIDDAFLGSSLCGGEVGYNFAWQAFRPGRQFELAAEGFFDVDLDPYFKDEIILGFEWQFAQNWAFDAKAIYWELGDMIMNTTQRDPLLMNAQGLNNTFTLSTNSKNFQTTLRSLGVVDEQVIADFKEPFKEYTALQLQLNRRYNNGWAWYNNLTWAKLETTGSGAWWDNSSSTYGEDLGSVMTQGQIDFCTASNAPGGGDAFGGTRTVPVDCEATLGHHLGQPISTIHRAGRDGLGGGVGPGDGFFGSGVDRPYIFKSFGFKQWNVGKYTLNVGGLFNLQDGAAYGRGELVPQPSGDQALFSVYVPLERNGVRRLPAFYDLNLTFAWGFPLTDRVRGQLRVEGTNVTNQQDQVNVGLYAEPIRVRREFQRPSQIRTSLSISF